MLAQQLQRLVLVALHYDHVRQMYLRVHSAPQPPELIGQVKRRPQPRLSLLQCVSAYRRDTAGAGGVRSSLVVLGSRSRPQHLPEMK